jgi:hypothetical protein
MLRAGVRRSVSLRAAAPALRLPAPVAPLLQPSPPLACTGRMMITRPFCVADQLSQQQQKAAVSSAKATLTKMLDEAKTDVEAALHGYLKDDDHTQQDAKDSVSFAQEAFGACCAGMIWQNLSRMLLLLRPPARVLWSQLNSHRRYLPRTSRNSRPR